MGYHILLVDDEELALRGIEQGVDWAALSITKVFKTHNMETALRMLKTYEIDIVLTDIEMPEGSGLELIRAVRTQWPDIICIFYTCHAEFSYAQEAVRMGVLDYLLKPIPYGELETILKKAIQLIAKQQEHRQIEEILSPAPQSDSEDSAIDMIKKYIADNISAEISREELARLVFMNPDYLSRLFKKREGIGLSEYIVKKKLGLARELLKHTQLSVVDIAARVGFSYSSYFIKIFRKNEGITPQQYREKYAANNRSDR